MLLLPPKINDVLVLPFQYWYWYWQAVKNLDPAWSFVRVCSFMVSKYIVVLAGKQYVSELNFEECVVVVDYTAIRIYLVVPFLPYRN